MPSPDMKALVDAITVVMNNNNTQAAAAAAAALQQQQQRHQHQHHQVQYHPTAVNNNKPLRKRKHEDYRKEEDAAAAVSNAAFLLPPAAASTSGSSVLVKKPAKRAKSNNANVNVNSNKRLEQNRLAAIESRRRKKVMVEELQRSVAFYTKANSSLKNQNRELEGRILLARQRTASNAASDCAIKKCVKEATLDNDDEEVEPIEVPRKDLPVQDTDVTHFHPPREHNLSLAHQQQQQQQQEQDRSSEAEAHFAATQALYKSMGFPPGAARAAATTFSQFATGTHGTTHHHPVPNHHDEHKEVVPTTVSSTTQLFVPSSFNKVEEDNIVVVAPSPIKIDNNNNNNNNNNNSEQDKTTANDNNNNNNNNNSATSYIEALNRFAMQQAVAANAAAAAATAAIQAANFHCQFIKNHHLGGAVNYNNNNNDGAKVDDSFNVNVMTTMSTMNKKLGVEASNDNAAAGSSFPSFPFPFNTASSSLPSMSSSSPSNGMPWAVPFSMENMLLMKSPNTNTTANAAADGQ